MDYKLYWTEEAVKDLENILDYLMEKWSLKEVEDFKQKLSKQLHFIMQFPFMFPVSIQNPTLRKAVLSKQTSIYYKIEKNIIYLVYLFVNQKDSAGLL